MGPPKAVDHDYEGRAMQLKNLNKAFSAYESASKAYLTAVREVDSTLEQVAAALRQLSLGEVNALTKDCVETFCTVVDNHKAARNAAGAAPQSARSSKRPSCVSASNSAPPTGASEYFFPDFMNDLNSTVTPIITELRQVYKVVESNRHARADAGKSYEKYRSAVDRKEAMYAKKNKSTADSKTYAKAVAKRDEYKAKVDVKDKAFVASLDDLLAKRTTALQRIVAGMSELSTRYWGSLAATMRSTMPPPEMPRSSRRVSAAGSA